MGILGGITKPLANVAQNAAKAGKIKSIKAKIKVKMQPGEDQPKGKRTDG